MKRVAATLMFDEENGKIYVVADDINDNDWIPQISLRDAISKGKSWETVERAGDNDD